MTEAIQIALIGLMGSMLGSLMGILVNTKLTTYRLEQLEKKVQAHNNLIDRTYKLEANEEVVTQELDNIKRTMDQLKKYHMQ